MPEPFTLAALLAGKMIAGHAVAAHSVAAGTVAAGTATAGSGHVAAFLFVGLAVGTTLYAIATVLKALVEKGAMTKDKARSYMDKAKTLPEHKRKEMQRDLEAMNEKWQV